jgi:uncharacterized membrane protein YphA (DoxX/SURF4 family)
MNTVIWIFQILVGLAFLAAGLMKLTQPIEKLAGMMSWVNHFPVMAVRGIGAIEVLGALGVILPAATGILPILTPLAALGLAITMVGAIVTHLRLNETAKSVAPLVLLVFTLVIVYGRFVVVPLN